LFTLGILAGIMIVFALLAGVIFSPSILTWILAILAYVWDSVSFVLKAVLATLAVIVFEPIFQFVMWIYHLFDAQKDVPKADKPVKLSSVQDDSGANLPIFLSIMHWVLLILLVLLLFLVCRHFWGVLLRSMHRLKSDDGEDVDEIREPLERTGLRQRWQGWRTGRNIDRLAPNSVRALYQKLLQGLAAPQTKLGRAAIETPAEYQARLLIVLQTNKPVHQGTDPELDARCLGELTRLYMLERYGGRPAPIQPQIRLRTWLPGFIRRMIKRKVA
jgi:hypothetical protein